MCWIAMRGAMQGKVSAAFEKYHIPLSNTGGAVMIFDHEHQPAQRALAAE